MSGERVGKAIAVAVRELAQLVLVRHRAGGGARSEQAAAEPGSLLVRPVDEPNGDRRRPLGRDAAKHLDAGDDVQAAVEPAAVWDGVHVPADEHGSIGSSTEREPLVPGGVDRLLGARAWQRGLAATHEHAPTCPSMRRAARRSRPP